VNKHIKALELTKKGLQKIFDDELLYKEFFDYAVKKRSVENAVRKYEINYYQCSILF